MKISKKAEYGLRAMIYLAKNKDKKTISIREISKEGGMPFEFLGKIFADLEKAKLVKAKHGASGGYILAKPANKITPANIMAVLEEALAMANCAGCPMAGGCTSENVWGEIEDSLDSALSAITLAELAKPIKRKK
jgi:Rrf2 family protein